MERPSDHELFEKCIKEWGRGMMRICAQLDQLHAQVRDLAESLKKASKRPPEP